MGLVELERAQFSSNTCTIDSVTVVVSATPYRIPKCDFFTGMGWEAPDTKVITLGKSELALEIIDNPGQEGLLICCITVQHSN